MQGSGFLQGALFNASILSLHFKGANYKIYGRIGYFGIRAGDGNVSVM